MIFAIPMVIIMTWIYDRSGRSIQGPVLFHASMNTFPFVIGYFMPGFALLFVLAAFFVVADRMWKRQAAVPVLLPAVSRPNVVDSPNE